MGTGQVYYQWHHIDQAHRCFARAIQQATLGGYSDAEIYHRVILSRLLLSESQGSPGDLAAARARSRSGRPDAGRSACLGS